MTTPLMDLLKEKRKKPEDILALIKDGDDIILPLANGEPKVILDCIEAHATQFRQVRLHQMHALRQRDYINGKYADHLKHVTTEVDFFGQCASETVGGKYYSSSGGQSDFARGARFAKQGKGFICMHSTTKQDTISRIRPQLSLGSAVTTSKNDVDRVVTEYGVAELRGRSISERTRALIRIAHPKFRDELTFEARKLGFLN